MNLVNRPSCAKEVNGTARVCPHCGHVAVDSLARFQGHATMADNIRANDFLASMKARNQEKSMNSATPTPEKTVWSGLIRILPAHRYSFITLFACTIPNI
jgi:hypothetical protein